MSNNTEDRADVYVRTQDESRIDEITQRTARRVDALERCCSLAVLLAMGALFLTIYLIFGR